MQDFNFHVQDLYLFYHVVHKGGFLKAADALNTCQAKMSRRIARLEEALNTTLLHRNMRDISLTESGKIIFKAAEEILKILGQAHTDLRSHHQEMQGPITISATTGFGNFWLLPVMQEFSEKFGQVTFGVKNNDLGNADLMLGEADITIASSKPDFRESLEYSCLCAYPLSIYASKDYLEKRGVPELVRDLDHHSIIAWKEPLLDYMKIDNYLLYMGRTQDNPRTAFIRVENDLSLVQSVKDGLGIGFLADFFAHNQPMLKKITLKDQPSFPLESMHKKYLVYPKSIQKIKRHAIFIEFIKEKAKELNHLSEQPSEQ